MSWPRFWSRSNWLSIGLSPLAAWVARIANNRYQDFKKHRRIGVQGPLVMVVGNLVVGGSGKTPLISWLIPRLINEGWRVGVIARGYAGQAANQPLMVTADSDPAQVGDEPVLLAQLYDVPIVVCTHRDRALQMMTQVHTLDIVISDDGLQHYALARDIDIAVFDASRENYGIGNGRCLPAGPLREALTRLQDIDFILFNGQLDGPVSWLPNEQACFSFELKLTQAYNLKNPAQKLEMASMANQSVVAVAGIGHPERFFEGLRQFGLKLESYSFKDHHLFTEKDFSHFDPTKPLLMTAKDAVKCQKFAKANWWVCPVDLIMADGFESALLARLRQDPRLNANSID